MGWNRRSRGKTRYFLVLLSVVLLFSLLSPVSVRADGTVIHVVQYGQNLSSIAAYYGTSVRAIMRANGIRNPNRIYVGQRLRIPVASRSSRQGQRVHVVRWGETLSGIAARYGVSVWALMRANGLRSANRIYAGQRLLIPGRGKSSTSVAAPAPASAGKWIEIDISRQRLTAYVGRTPVFSTLVSTGLPRTPTVIGRFAIRYKLRRQHMRGPGYSLPNVPWVMYFYSNYAIHGTYWHNAFGRPMSHGCVNLRIADARWLYYWAPVGTPVIVHP